MVTALAAGIYALLCLESRTGTLDLISEENPVNRDFLSFVRDFATPESLVLILEGPDPDANRSFADALAPRLDALRGLVKDVFYKFDIEFFRRRGLLYLDLDTLEAQKLALDGNRDFLATISAHPKLETLFREVRNRAVDPSAMIAVDSATRQRGLRLLEGVLDGMTAALIHPEGAAAPPWEQFLASGGADLVENAPADGYNTSRDGRMVFVLVEPADLRNDYRFLAGFIREVREVVDELRGRFPTVRVGFTGTPALAEEEMRISQRDMTVAMIFSLIGIMALFVLAFGGLSRPFMALLALLVGMAWSYGVITLVIGYLNLLSLSCGLILIGLGINYSVHFVSRFQEELSKTDDVAVVLERTFSGVGEGLLTGGATTTAAFYTTTLVEFPGLRQLGFVAGTGVFLCLVAMMTALPSFLVVWEKWRQRRRHGLRGHARKMTTVQLEGAMGTLRRRPGAVFLGCALVSLLSVIGIFRISFDSNLLHLQAKDTETVRNELKLMENSPQPPEFGAVLVDRYEDISPTAAHLRTLPTVKDVLSLEQLIPARQASKRAIIKEMQTALRDLPLPVRVTKTVDPAAISVLLGDIHSTLGVAGPLLSVLDADSDMAQGVENLRQSLNGTLEALRSTPSDGAVESLGRYQTTLFSDLSEKLNLLLSPAYERELTYKELPHEVYRRFVGAGGRFLIYAYPAANVWEDSSRDAFVANLRQVDPRVTGHPILVHEAIRLIWEGYQRAGLYALVVVAILVLLDFRGLRATVLALTPLMAGVLWMVGLLKLLGLSLNPANLIALPLILGIGIDNGVHLVHRFREEGAPEIADLMRLVRAVYGSRGQSAGFRARGREIIERLGQEGGHSAVVALRTTGRAVLLSSLATMMSFGCMAMATHRGVASMGFLLLIGVGACLLSALIMLPAFFSLVVAQGGKL